MSSARSTPAEVRLTALCATRRQRRARMRRILILPLSFLINSSSLSFSSSARTMALAIRAAALVLVLVRRSAPPAKVSSSSRMVLTEEGVNLGCRTEVVIPPPVGAGVVGPDCAHLYNSLGVETSPLLNMPARGRSRARLIGGEGRAEAWEAGGARRSASISTARASAMSSCALRRLISFSASVAE